MVSDATVPIEPQRETDDWSRPVELALKHADIATKLVQFFVVASVAVGGWVIASDDIRQTPVASADRLYWASLYTMMSLPIWFTLRDLQRRINACYALARQSIPETGANLARDFDPRLVVVGFPVFVTIIDLIIVIAK